MCGMCGKLTVRRDLQIGDIDMGVESALLRPSHLFCTNIESFDEKQHQLEVDMKLTALALILLAGVEAAITGSRQCNQVRLPFSNPARSAKGSTSA